MRPLVVSMLMALPGCGVAASDSLATIAVADLPQARRAGLEVVQEYGSFVLVRADDDALLQAAHEGLQLESQPHGYALALPYDRAIDPQQRAPYSPQSAVTLPDGLALLQFKGPTVPQWLDDLRAAGVDVIQYLHPYTYIVHQRDQALVRAAHEQSAIRWIGQWPLSARIAPQLLARTDATLEVRLLSSTHAVPDRSALSAVGAEVVEQTHLDATIQMQTVRIAASRLADLAALPDVLSVQPIPTDGGSRGEMSNQQLASNISGSDVPAPGYLGWLAGFGVNGTGIRMANVDEGFNENHPDLLSRGLSCVGLTCGGGNSAHGTHTAGIMAADGSSGVLVSGFLRGLGVAPGAKLIEQSFALRPVSGGILRLMKDSVSNGAAISNNSWGTSSQALGYDADARQVDVGVRDADDTTAGDQPLIYVQAIANGNGGTSSQGAPDDAKNAISVGATYSQLNPSQLHKGPAGSPHWQDIAFKSAHGPAMDGRRLPVIVAPGCLVDSTVLAPNFYDTMCGTSMAAPHVSGALALYVQSYQQRTGIKPSPALAKATLLAATRDLNGRRDASSGVLGHRPDNKQGWGQLRLDRVLAQLDQSLSVDQQTVFTSTGQSWTIELEPRDAAVPVQVLLAFTDAPGHGTCASVGCTTPGWNNDLNLEVTASAVIYKGNIFNSQGWAQAGGVADEKNNAEGVLFEAGRVTSRFTATVRAANISADALPNSSGTLQQDFALFCSNCREASLFQNGLE